MELRELQEHFEEIEEREDMEIDYTIPEEPERKFLVQAIGEDYSHVELMTEAELIKFIDFQDIYGEVYWIYEVTEVGYVTPLYYVGWQPNCLIQLRNEQNEIVVSGYGTDH